MYIPNDNDMLYSMVNMKLRDQYDSLDELCDCEDVDMAMIIARLNGAGYEYDEEHNKFTAVQDAPEVVNPDKEVAVRAAMTTVKR